jgi:tagatose-1,6-bisphosphate aldolase non-catalytic subunit AgaZ/GatZ
MCERLDHAGIPLQLLGKYLPQAHEAVRAGRIRPVTEEIQREGVAAALRPYVAACRGRNGARS